MLEKIFGRSDNICAVNTEPVFSGRGGACASTKQAHRRLASYITRTVIRECMYWISAFLAIEF